MVQTRGVRVRIVAGSLFALLLGLFSYAAVLDGAASSMPWCETTPISWDLFQCPAPADAVHRNEAAAIHMTIRWHARYSVTSRGRTWVGHVESVAVTNTMEPSLSWVVPGKADDRVLGHEQAHFDLNEVYRRKLEIVLSSVQADSGSKDGALDALHEALHRKAEEILERLEAVQARYDAESGHGNNPAGQARWEAQIAAWLRDPAAAP